MNSPHVTLSVEFATELLEYLRFGRNQALQHQDAVAVAEWQRMIETLFDALLGNTTSAPGKPLLTERYWCGCVRESRWVPRCERHNHLEHDEEPPTRNQEAASGVGRVGE